MSTSLITVREENSSLGAIPLKDEHRLNKTSLSTPG